MSVRHARSGDLLAVDPVDADCGLTGAMALVRDPQMEVMRWVLPANREVPEHLAYGPATVACVRGDVLLCLRDREHRMRAGAVVYLAAGERHSLRALADSVLLVTMVLRPVPADEARSAPAGGIDPPHGERTGRSVCGK